ncbi:MAG: hypothetical protein Q8N94_09950 [Methanoregula sp.]|nr:hypothetical protein [Methanoregula sp.]
MKQQKSPTFLFLRTTLPLGSRSPGVEDPDRFRVSVAGTVGIITGSDPIAIAQDLCEPACAYSQRKS